MRYKETLARLRPRNWATRVLAITGILAGMSMVGDVRATPATFTFTPPNPGWVAALNNGMPIIDGAGDSSGSRDIVGDAANPALYLATDATHIYFRLRVNSDPLQMATNFKPFGWGCVINTDSDLTTYEWSTLIDGVNNPDVIYFYKNSVTTTPNSPLDIPDMPPIVSTFTPLMPIVGHAQVVVAGSNFGGNADYFIDWALDRASLIAAGFNPANPASYACGSANNGMNVGADCTGSTTCGDLDTQFTDPTGCGPLGCTICGDAQHDANEGCDDGNLNNGDGCNSVCLLELGQPCGGVSPACASGYCDPAGNICACDATEDCPVGQFCNTVPNPNVCIAPGCGNSVLEGDEGCDDGNLNNGDGCNSVCLLELGQPCMASGVCESGFCDPMGNVCACDSHTDCAPGQLCNTEADPNQCVAPGCGNFVLEPPTEGCDDGDTTPGDGCNANCLIELTFPCTVSSECASEFCDPTNKTCACNEDADCTSDEVCNTAANPNQCVAKGCGNFVLEPSEGCDDGNTVAGDGCNGSCLLEIGEACTLANTCASGFCDPADGTCACNEDTDCPAGQQCNTSLEPNECVPLGCGNGIVSGNEACDDGNLMNGDGCTAQCLLELGQPCTNGTECDSQNCDSTTNTCVECNDDADCPTGEVCDTAPPPNACVPAGCGNSVLEMGEACDDGNMTAGDGCTALCLLELGQSCTDGTECDSQNCDSTTNTCVECNDDADCPMGQSCVMNACIPAGCGNGVLEMGEACDDGNMTAGDGCTTMCLLELGQACTDNTECDSQNCDGTTNTCVECNDDADCPMGQICDTSTKPPVCVPNGLCTLDSDCGDGLLCDETSGQCVECTQDSQCVGGTCTTATHTCELGGIIVEGGSCFCTSVTTPANDNNLPFALFGLLALGMTLRRRR